MPVQMRDPSTLSSKIPMKFLEKDQLAMLFLPQSTHFLKNRKLSEKLQSLVVENGISVSDHTDIALKSSIKELNERGQNDFPDGSALKLLFQQQLQQSSAPSKQMRWHPIMIRWCLGLYHT